MYILTVRQKQFGFVLAVLLVSGVSLAQPVAVIDTAQPYAPVISAAGHADVVFDVFLARTANEALAAVEEPTTNHPVRSSRISDRVNGKTGRWLAGSVGREVWENFYMAAAMMYIQMNNQSKDRRLLRGESAGDESGVDLESLVAPVVMVNELSFWSGVVSGTVVGTTLEVMQSIRKDLQTAAGRKLASGLLQAGAVGFAAGYGQILLDQLITEAIYLKTGNPTTDLTDAEIVLAQQSLTISSLAQAQYERVQALLSDKSEHAPMRMVWGKVYSNLFTILNVFSGVGSNFWNNVWRMQASLPSKNIEIAFMAGGFWAGRLLVPVIQSAVNSGVLARATANGAMVALESSRVVLHPWLRLGIGVAGGVLGLAGGLAATGVIPSWMTAAADDFVREQGINIRNIEIEGDYRYMRARLARRKFTTATKSLDFSAFLAQQQQRRNEVFTTQIERFYLSYTKLNENQRLLMEERYRPMTLRLVAAERDEQPGETPEAAGRRLKEQEERERKNTPSRVKELVRENLELQHQMRAIQVEVDQFIKAEQQRWYGVATSEQLRLTADERQQFLHESQGLNLVHIYFFHSAMFFAQLERALESGRRNDPIVYSVDDANVLIAAERAMNTFYFRGVSEKRIREVVQPILMRAEAALKAKQEQATKAANQEDSPANTEPTEPRIVPQVFQGSAP